MAKQPLLKVANCRSDSQGKLPDISTTQLALKGLGTDLNQPLNILSLEMNALISLIQKQVVSESRDTSVNYISRSLQMGAFKEAFGRQSWKYAVIELGHNLDV